MSAVSELINKDRLEAFVIDRVKANILTEENLAQLVRLTKEEIGQAKNGYEDRLAVIDGQLEDLSERLHKLYSALETQEKFYLLNIVARGTRRAHSGCRRLCGDAHLGDRHFLCANSFDESANRYRG